MALISLGVYLRRLRKDARLSTQDLAEMVGTSNSQISRIERGEQEMRSSLLASITIALNASFQDVLTLLVNDDVDEKTAEQLAEQWIYRDKSNVSQQLIHPDVVKIASTMTDYELGKWVNMGEKLLEERLRRS